MTTYLEQITALGELHGREGSPVSSDNYNEIEEAAYLKGYERGQWFADYQLGWEAACKASLLPEEAAIYNIELIPGSSQAYIMGYNSAKQYG